MAGAGAALSPPVAMATAAAADWARGRQSPPMSGRQHGRRGGLFLPGGGAAQKLRGGDVFGGSRGEKTAINVQPSSDKPAAPPEPSYSLSVGLALQPSGLSDSAGQELHQRNAASRLPKPAPQHR